MAATTDLVPFFFGAYMVRILVDDNGEYWFVAKDVCRVLDIENVGNVLAALDEDEKITIHNADGNPRAGIPYQFVVISESGLYALVFRSRKPEAKKFSKWVRSEVLPALRRTGRYEMNCARPRGRIIRQNVATPFPEDLPDEVLCLRPHMRQTLWQQALQTARLESADAAYAWEVFISLCRMVGAKKEVPFASIPDKNQQIEALIRSFAQETLFPSPGSRIPSGQLYNAFRLWMEKRGALCPGKRVFTEFMRGIYRTIRSNGTWFADVSFRNDVQA